MARSKHKVKFIRDNEKLSFLPESNRYHKLSPSELLTEDPEYMLWIKNNCPRYRFSEGIRKGINQYKKLKNI